MAPLLSEEFEESGVHLQRSRGAPFMLLLLLLLLWPLDWLIVDGDDDDTWTHLFFHFLTGPLNTVCVGPYRAEARPILDPTPSISLFFFLSLSKFRTFSDGLTGEIEESLARVVSDASYCPAQAFGCFAPYIKLNSMKIRCYDVVLAKQSGLTVFVKRQMVEFVGSLYPLSLIIS